MALFITKETMVFAIGTLSRLRRRIGVIPHPKEPFKIPKISEPLAAAAPFHKNYRQHLQSSQQWQN
jgi:hypothetical protein